MNKTERCGVIVSIFVKYFLGLIDVSELHIKRRALNSSDEALSRRELSGRNSFEPSILTRNSWAGYLT